MAPKIITISNQKGGVAKTTTSVSLAHGLALKGYEVLVVDLDPQGNVATALGLNPESNVFYLLTDLETKVPEAKKWIRNSGREHLWVIPGNRETMGAQILMNAMDKPISHVRDALKRFMNNGLGYIILDTSPSVGGIQERAIWAADLVIIPTAADYLATDGVRQSHETMLRLQREKTWKGSFLGVLPTFFEDNVREHKAGLEDLRKVYGSHVLPLIHKAATLRECPGAGVTIFEKDPSSRAAQEYEELIKIVLRH